MVEKENRSVKLPHLSMRVVLLFIVTFWVIMYSNSRMLEGVGTYNIVHLFPIPRELRIIELASLVFLFLLAFTRKMPKVLFWISIGTFIYLLLSVLRLGASGKFNFAGIQDIYIRVVPFFVFVIFAQGPIASKKELNYFVRFFIAVLIINLIVFLFIQFPTGDHEDHFAGLFEDAHLFCNVLLIFSTTLFYDYLNTGKKFSLLTSIVLFIVSFYPSNEKVIAFTLLLLGLLWLHHILKELNVIGKIAILSSIFLLVFAGFKYIQKKDGGELWVRAQMMYDMFGVENIGPVIAWPMAWNEIQSSPSSLLFGLGAGEYGWIAASRNVLEGKGSVHSKLFEFEFNNENLNNAGYLFRTNTWSSLLAEFGILGFIAFIGVLFLIIKGVWKCETRDRLERNLKFAFYFILTIVVYQGFFTPYSNWSVPVLMFPAMYIAAYFHQKQKSDTDTIPGAYNQL